MGKLSFLGLLTRFAKVLVLYFYVSPIICVLFWGTVFDLILYYVTLNVSTAAFLELIIIVPTTFIYVIIQSMREGYRDSFYGRYSLTAYSLIAFSSAVFYSFADFLVRRSTNTRFNVCPIAHLFNKMYWSPQISSIVYWAAMCGVMTLFYFLGRRRALYENAEAVYKTEKSIAEEEQQKKDQKQ